MNLIGHVVHPHTATTLQGHVFEDSDFGGQIALTDCLITNCRFSRSRIHLENLPGCTFLNCEFFECEFVISDAETEITKMKSPESYATFLACSGDKSFEVFIKTEDQITRAQNTTAIDPEERAILERFWPPGRAHYSEKKALRTLYLGLSGSRTEQLAASRAIQRLEARGIITLARDSANLNTEKINEVRQILGR
jgi:hypothetical protein